MEELQPLMNQIPWQRQENGRKRYEANFAVIDPKIPLSPQPKVGALGRGEGKKVSLPGGEGLREGDIFLLLSFS